MKSIGANIPVIVDTQSGDGLLTMTWAEFRDVNRDAINGGDMDLAEMEATLLKVVGCTYHGGGGASAAWTIRIDAEKAEALFRQWQATRTWHDDLEDEMGADFGFDGNAKGYAYQGGFIIQEDTRFWFPVCQSEFEFPLDRLEEAERTLFDEWCADYFPS